MDIVPISDRLSAALEYIVASVQESLGEIDILLPRKDIIDRAIIALHSRSLVNNIVKQIRLCPKVLSDMSLKDKFAAASWKHVSSSGDRDTSRSVIKELSSIREDR